MHRSQRPYLRPDGGELDCAYILSEEEYAPGFLRLPSPHDTGEVRFLENVPDLADAFSQPTLDPVPITLMDGKGSGTDACLLESFVISTRHSSPLRPMFPIALTVNQAIVGTSDPEAEYATATVRCPSLVGFLGNPVLDPSRAAELGRSGLQRAAAEIPGLKVSLREGVEVDDRQTTELSLRWYGEIVLEGAPRSLQAWSETLAEHLCLYALLIDRPLRPAQIFADSRTGRVDFFASWPDGSAPESRKPLAILPEIDHAFTAVVGNWQRLLEEAHDLVDHVVGFQLHSEGQTITDLLLSLSRTLELYFDFSPRFDGRYRPRSEHAKLVTEAIERLTETIAEDDREWMKEALMRSNQKRVVAQTEAILDDLGGDILSACRIDDAAEFAARAKAARNHYTHPTAPPKSNVPDGRGLLIHVNQLWFLARACILIELGFTRHDVALVLQRSARRGYLLR